MSRADDFSLDVDQGKGDGASNEGSGSVASQFHPGAGRVDVHPLVLLSLVDHYARVNKNLANKKRVAGLLLGGYQRLANGQQILDINNCFAVPFDEDATDLDVWFLDTNYAEEMFRMFKKVLPKISVVGWYSSGPTISPNDLHLHLLVANRFCPNPIYCVVNTDPNKKGTPVLAYTTIAGREGTPVEFRNVPTDLGALEAEEIGIEHLLRDLTDSTVTTLSTQIVDRQLSLQRLEQLLATVQQYLADVAEGRIPMNLDVLEVVQEVVNIRPRLHQLKASKEMIVWTNDQTLSTFVAAVSRCVMALYDVILNRRKLSRELKEAREKRELELAKSKEKETAEKAKKKAEKTDNEEETQPQPSDSK